MADREINIPMGPDRTGAISLPEVVPGAGSPADQTIAQPPISTADLRGFDVEGAPASAETIDAWLKSPMEGESEPAEAASQSEAGLAEEAEDDVRQQDWANFFAGEDAVVEAPEGGANEVAEAVEAEAAKPVNDVAASLGALKDSFDQGRELKAREKDREELAGKIDADREELADREDILANYQSIVYEQDSIVEQNTYQRDNCKAELSQVVAQSEETIEALGRMRDYHDVQLQPLETALGRAQATADQAKNDERSRKSELSAAESEVRRAGEGEDATTARARLDVARSSHEESVARSNAAKEALEEAQRAYDDLKEQVEQAEAPLENAIADLEARADQLKDEIARLGDAISAASKRRQYCDSVYQYPAETDKLRQSVAADEAMLARIDEENDELRDRLAISKAKSTKAKVLIVGVVVFIILVIFLFWYVSSR